MKHKLKWYPLDTSAKIYPAIESRRNPALFRMAMKLKEDVVEQDLLQALKDIKPRFPYFNVHMKKGLFWHYLEENTHPLQVWPDTGSPCERIYPEFNNGYLYKVKFFGRTVALDMFHVLTDGYGAMEFLKCLINRYLVLRGKMAGVADGVIDYTENPHKEEAEDAFLKVAKSEPLPAHVQKDRSLFNKRSTFQIPSRILTNHKNRVITGIVSVEDLKKIAKQYNATITQLIGALYLEAMIHLQDRCIKQKKKHLPVSVQVPANMRNFYNYKAMRNFSLFAVPGVDPRKVSELSEIIETLKTFLSEHLSYDYLLTMIHENCQLGTNKVLMHVPVDIKNLVIRYITNTQGSTQFSGTVSNLGVLKLDEKMAQHIAHVNFVLGPSQNEKCSCGVVGYNKLVYISFARNIESTYIERHVFRQLVQMGAKVKVKSND